MSNEKQPRKKLPEMKQVALSIVRGESTIVEIEGEITEVPGKWQLVRIKFDLASGQVGDVSVQEQEDLGFAIENFNLAVEREIVPYDT